MMRLDKALRAVVAAVGMAMGAAGPAMAEQPLAVIDWLGRNDTPSVPAAQPRPAEPPVARTALVPDVAVAPLAQGGPRLIGLVPPEVTGLPVGLWSGSTLDTLTRLLTDLPDPTLPAAQALLYTVLLAEAHAPGGTPSDGDALALARVEKLMQQGALDPAQSLMEQAGVTRSAAHFDLWMQISLLTGTEGRACDLLQTASHLTQDYGIRIFCAARAGRWEDAALTFGSAEALDLLPREKLDLLARFLDPEAMEAAASPVPPRRMDPLSFRLFETIGEPLPTGNLPRTYAVADLRDLSGWKAQLEAAERLTRAGALPDNRLLGLYTDRRPAASGGIWDRVADMQRFETALASGSAEAVAKTLPPVWEAMRAARLEVPFATLFADRLAPFTLPGPAQSVSEKVQLLSPAYEATAARIGGDSPAVRVALGEPPTAQPADLQKAAIHDAFTAPAPRTDLVEMARKDRLGEAILRTLVLLDAGTTGKPKALAEALATLRALGLEDTARRAALQILLLER